MRRGSSHSQDDDERSLTGGASALGRRGQRQWKQVTASMKGFAGRLSISGLVLLLCMVSLVSQLRQDGVIVHSHIDVNSLWTSSSSSGWRPSSAPRSFWPPPPKKSNGYLVVRCNGGLNQQRSAICNAVLAARIMNATLVLPELDTNSFWNDKSGFAGIYDVEHFIKSLRHDVKIVESLPYVSDKKKKKMKAFQIAPPRDGPPSWYETEALAKMKQHGAIYLTPFSHRLAEEIPNAEYQRLRCRVNFHALRFKPDVMQLSNQIVSRLRAEGHFMSIHLRFEMDMLAFAGCLAIFKPEEQEILRKYREQNFAKKRLVYNERRLIGKCPLTPEEVGLILQAMGFDNSTRLYLAAGDIFGGERFMQPLREMYPHLENRTTVAAPEELEAVQAEGRGLLGPAVDYMVCLLSDIFMPTYDGPSNFANNLLGHRLYYGFRTSIQPNRKALAPIFMARESGGGAAAANFEAMVRGVMSGGTFGRSHRRVNPESFYTNPWPECFCRKESDDPRERCPANTRMNATALEEEGGDGIKRVLSDDVE
ncbi:O-fucosyltransferase 1 isoform X2 [Selaginella moellendorffii]|uniref:O-fucosyltransferase 1 isoform X2 n=1 Tax=Selaginella moellendorffii TaxID=88036 RepID=UPI000D1CED35|nr:O-fucosyltransferase 1 isoform X2 [Selaginella moellendorffii]|eukprot:XP_024537439.1 O-fucosyltransferase 1 isoform X2 [Selaginella moellendorffii]